MGFDKEILITVKEEKMLEHFELLCGKMFELPEEKLKAQLHSLNVLRLSSSRSNGSQSPDALDRWNKAQLFIYQNPQSLFQFDFIKQVNEILTGNAEVERLQDVFAGGAAFLSNDEKDKELLYFENDLLPRLANYHPIVASTALRYWIISLHPFKDGNGRTSQSIADAWLMMNQYPPLFFKNPYQGTFAYIPTYREEFSFNDALVSSFTGLDNAFTFLFNV